MLAAQITIKDHFGNALSTSVAVPLDSMTLEMKPIDSKTAPGEGIRRRRVDNESDTDSDSDPNVEEKSANDNNEDDGDEDELPPPLSFQFTASALPSVLSNSK